MQQRTRIKSQIIATVLTALKPSWPHTNTQLALQTWFYNIRPTGGLRLTDAGYSALTKAELQHWFVQIESIKNSLTKSVLLALDRQLQYPFYIDFKRKGIVFFSSKEAMTATLYNSIEDFIAHYNC